MELLLQNAAYLEKMQNIEKYANFSLIKPVCWGKLVWIWWFCPPEWIFIVFILYSGHREMHYILTKDLDLNLRLLFVSTFSCQNI